jgi:hypothetical protein
MIDDLESLSGNAYLLQLLNHYATLGAADRTLWQDRLMKIDGLGPRDLHRLHGELIAFGWIEQNTGMTPVLKPDLAAACYRVTTHGLRALKMVSSGALAA